MGLILRMQRYEFLGNLPNFIVLFFRKPLIFRNFVAYLCSFVTACTAFFSPRRRRAARGAVTAQGKGDFFSYDMLIKTKAIVLHCLKYGESQYIIDMFTEAMGRVAFIQTVRPTGRGRIRKQLFQPLSILDIEYDHRQRVKLQRLKNAAIACPFASIPFDAFKLSIALFVAEFTAYCTRSEQTNRQMFLFIDNSVRWLDACERGFANFHIVYMLHFARFVGFYPNLDELQGAAACYFDLRGGCFVAHVPVHRDFLEPSEAGTVRLLMRLDYTTMRLLSLSRSERNRIVEVVLQYYRLHQPDFPEMKSLPVLMQLFG